MKDIGKTIKSRAMVSMFMHMEINIRASGSKI